VRLAVQRGEFVAVMGASGSGKSTLLHLLGGLDLPTAGRIVIEGFDLTRLGDRDRTLFRRRRLGVVFQAFNLLPSLTARENIALPLIVDGASAGTIDPRTDELLVIVDLVHRAGHRPQALSGGEQQRVAVARALVNDPAIVLADEPTGNLDSQHAEEIWRLLRRLASEQQRTIVAVTHEAAGAAYADRVIVLRDGKIVGQIVPGGEADAALVATRYAELAGQAR
jgi:putative ABC transport system ATP-binding protein